MMRPENFLLGIHHAGWMADPRCTGTPLFVSRAALMNEAGTALRKTLPKAVTDWSLDSQGFTKLQLLGRWDVSNEQYVADIRRCQMEIGRLLWSAPKDWMCERAVIAGLVERRKKKACPACAKARRKSMGSPIALRVECLLEDERPSFVCDACGFRTIGKPPRINVAAWRAWAVEAGPVMAEAVAIADKLGVKAVVVFHGTGLSVEEHQRRTVENFLELRRLAPDLPIIPVLQGWTAADYWRCEDLYRDAGIDLRKEPLVGVGTVCRRQGTRAATLIMKSLAASGLRLHGFGFKVLGLRASLDDLYSADSTAWSVRARNSPPLPGHDEPGTGRPYGHINCANCLEYALLWWAALLEELRGRSSAGPLFEERPAA